MRNVRAVTTIASDPGTILQAFLEQQHLQAWWGVARSLVEAKPGGLWVLAWEISDTGIRYVSTGIIEKLIPHEYLKISGMTYLNPEREILGPMALEIKVARADENNSTAEVIQSGYQYGGDWDWYYDAVVNAWPVALKMLKEYLEKMKSDV